MSKMSVAEGKAKALLDIGLKVLIRVFYPDFISDFLKISERGTSETKNIIPSDILV